MSKKLVILFYCPRYDSKLSLLKKERGGKIMLQRLSNFLSAVVMSYYYTLIPVLTSEVGADEFNDGGSSNWGRNAAIGFAIGAILFGLAKVFMPEIVDAWKAKVLSFF